MRTGEDASIEPTFAKICGQDRRQFALLTRHRNFPRLLQRIVKGLQRAGNLEKLDMRSWT